MTRAVVLVAGAGLLLVGPLTAANAQKANDPCTRIFPPQGAEASDTLLDLSTNVLGTVTMDFNAWVIGAKAIFTKADGTVREFPLVNAGDHTPVVEGAKIVVSGVGRSQTGVNNASFCFHRF